jgi:hypothetical protein
MIKKRANGAREDIEPNGPYGKDLSEKNESHSFWVEGFARWEESRKLFSQSLHILSLTDWADVKEVPSANLEAPPNKWRFVGSLRTTSRGLFGG